MPLANHTYLNLYDLFVNQIAGGAEYTAIFIGLSFLVLAGLAARFRFPNSVTISIFAFYALLIGKWFSDLLAITLVLVAILFAWSISRYLSRG
jgi:hypothetical protein